jgi:hypothetical protein
VGNLFDYVDRHYNHGSDTYPLAHNPVTSYYVLKNDTLLA